MDGERIDGRWRVRRESKGGRERGRESKNESEGERVRVGERVIIPGLTPPLGFVPISQYH